MMRTLAGKALTLLAAALLAGCSSDGVAQERLPMDVEELRGELARDLPTGTRAREVSAYLVERDIEHSPLIDNAEMAHMGYDGQTRAIRSIVREVAGGLATRTDIAMTFTFDRQQRLIDIAVHEVHTGL